MDEAKLGGKTLRQTALKELEKVKFYPSVGIKKNRLYDRKSPRLVHLPSA